MSTADFVVVVASATGPTETRTIAWLNCLPVVGNIQRKEGEDGNLLSDSWITNELCKEFVLTETGGVGEVDGYVPTCQAY